ncbi:MAG: hypothetical protein IH943_03640 [Acidobacteria bacterium]|nr:hypothetical protein [Acidobacteriota bacterium]
MTTINRVQPDATLLRYSLTGNGLFSILTGAIALVFSTPLGAYMGVPPLVLSVVGVSVAVFGGTVYVVSRRSPINRRLAALTVMVDIVWVLGAVVLIGVFPETMTSEGAALLAVVSGVVGLFAALQSVGLRSSTASST